MRTNTATDKQVAFATTLGHGLAGLVNGDAERDAIVESLRKTWGDSLRDTKVMSATITTMLTYKGAWEKADRVSGTATARVDVPEGMHKVGDQIYKVQRAIHGSGNLYAKVLVQSHNSEPDTNAWFFDYAKGAMRLLSEKTKMSLVEAKAWGVLYGTCCRCGHTLTDEKSIADGIGPICASKF